MDYIIRISREKGWQVSPRGHYHFFPAGDYRVPDDMAPDIARRALHRGVGKRIDNVKDGAPENKVVKKKRGGTRASSRQQDRPSLKKSQKGAEETK